MHGSGKSLDSHRTLGHRFPAPRWRSAEGAAKKFLVATATGALFLAETAMGAHAKAFELPDGRPIVAIDLPNARSPEEIDKGAQAISPDAAIYVAFKVSNLEKTGMAVTEG